MNQTVIGIFAYADKLLSAAKELREYGIEEV